MTRTRLLALALLTPFALALPGCYKAEMEQAKAQAAAAEAHAKALETEAAAAKKDADANRAKAAVADAFKTHAVLATIVNGQVVGTDEIRLSDSGQFVRSGLRSRPTSAIRFTDGRLADQHIVVTRDNGKLNFEGDVKDSRPVGDWIWYSPDGNPAAKEVWKDGKLADLMTASISSSAKTPPATKPATTSKSSTGGKSSASGPTGPTGKSGTSTKPGATPPKPAATTPPPAAPVPSNNTPAANAPNVTWKSVSKSERDAWLKSTAPVFINLPELIRE